MVKNLLLALIPLFCFTLSAGAETSNMNGEEGSGVILRPVDKSACMELLCGHTYTSADFEDIKAGSISVSAYGDKVTFDNLVLECSKEGDEGSLLRFDPYAYYTLVLIGENRLNTKGYTAIGAGYLTITGEGSLTTDARYFDIYSYFGRDLCIENTTLICKGLRAVWSEEGDVVVNNSRFEGNELRNLSKLILIDCSIIIPYHGKFDPDEKKNSQIKTDEGIPASHFVIATAEDEDEVDVSSHISLSFANTKLLRGHTYTSADFSEIKSGSMSVSEDGHTLTLNNLEMVCEKESGEGNLLSIDTHEQKTFTIVLEGHNLLKTQGTESLYIGSVYQGDSPWQVTLTGSGSLTTSSAYFDLYLNGGQFILDHIKLDCLNRIAAPGTHIQVKASKFEGTNIRYCDQLTLEDCSFQMPYQARFVPFNPEEIDNYQIMDGYGGIAFYFLITTPDDVVPSYFYFKGETLLCGRTYTSADFGEIQSGSISVSDDGTSLTFDNLHINDESENENTVIEAVGSTRDFLFTVHLKGENVISTIHSVVMYCEYCTMTLTGDGSLTTKSHWYDFWTAGCQFVIDHTTLTSEGNTTIGNNMGRMDDVIVKHSTFRGNRFINMASLTLLNCAFVSPVGVFFDPYAEKNQLKDANGNSIKEGFEIQPVEGDFTHRVCPWDFGTVIVEKGTEKRISVSMKNDGENPVSEVSYILSIDGVEQLEQTFSLSEPYVRTGCYFTVPVSFPASVTAGSLEALITVTKVNGQENTSDRKTAKGLLATINEAVAHRVVVEEFTGTWCGSCPRGMAGLSLLDKEFGDSVITIAIHKYDPMEAKNYTSGSLSFPSAEVNRGDMVDPYYGSSGYVFGISEDVRRELESDASVGISVTASWADEAQTAIRTETQTVFLLDNTDATQYGIGYALLEDGMTGTGSSWAQNNFYSGSYTDDPYLQPYTVLPGYITDIAYDHVAVDAWEIVNGADCYTETIQTGIPQKKVYLCDISANELIQDKSRLSVVALLIDRTTRRIVNAAKTSVSSYDPSGIREIQTATDNTSAVFSISGYKLSSSDKYTRLPKGVYIRNGRKIVIK